VHSEAAFKPAAHVHSEAAFKPAASLNVAMDGGHVT